MASQTYADFTRSLIEDFRAHNGRTTSGPFVNSDVLLIHTTGAKSGQEHVTPVVFSRDGDRLVIVASKGGAPTQPAWFHNLVANPMVTVEAGGESFRARATVADAAERDRLYARHAAKYPGFLDYQKKTDRVIPVVLLDREG